MHLELLRHQKCLINICCESHQMQDCPWKRKLPLCSEQSWTAWAVQVCPWCQGCCCHPKQHYRLSAVLQKPCKGTHSKTGWAASIWWMWISLLWGPLSGYWFGSHKDTWALLPRQLYLSSAVTANTNTQMPSFRGLLMLKFGSKFPRPSAGKYW